MLVSRERRPSDVWREMTAEQKLQAAEAFWQDDAALVEQAEALDLIARRIRFRPKSVRALPDDRKARHLVPVAGQSETVATRLLVAYHLAHKRPMMAAFLDAVGVAHEDGVIADDAENFPTPEQVESAAKALRSQYPADEVAMYLSTLLVQDPDTWGGLAEDAPPPPLPPPPPPPPRVQPPPPRKREVIPAPATPTRVAPASEPARSQPAARQAETAAPSKAAAPRPAAAKRAAARPAASKRAARPAARKPAAATRTTASKPAAGKRAAGGPTAGKRAAAKPAAATKRTAKAGKKSR